MVKSNKPLHLMIPSGMDVLQKLWIDPKWTWHFPPLYSSLTNDTIFVQKWQINCMRRWRSCHNKTNTNTHLGQLQYHSSITKILSNLKIHQPIGINHFVQIIWALKINAKNSFIHSVETLIQKTSNTEFLL